MRKAVLALILLPAAAAQAKDVDWLMTWRPPTAAEAIPLVLAETAMAIDGLQSLDIKNHPGMVEGNPLLGQHPTDARILGMTGAAMLGLGVLWYAVPTFFRISLPIGIFVEETGTIVENRLSYGLTVRL